MSSKRRILIVDDDKVVCHYVAGLLQSNGYQVMSVNTGEEAMAQWRSYRPCLMLLDVFLPDTTGYALTRSILEAMGEPKIPVIFFTGLSDEQVINKCFDVGGDDFLSKPINDNELVVRVRAAIDRSDDYKSQYEQRNELAYHRDNVLREHEIAEKLFSNLMRSDQLDFAGVRYSLTSMSIFNGDLLLVMGTPDGRINMLVGDFTGHGLSAAIGSLPASEIFYAMTAKGFGIADILTEINRRLRSLLPVGMFLAACGIEISKEGSVARVWAGAIPDMLVRRVADGSVERVAAKHVAIGILEPDEFSAVLEIVTLNPGDKLYVFTDGMPESENAAGEMFGFHALMQVVESTAEGEEIFDEIYHQLDEFRAGHEQSDDLTLLEYTCLDQPGMRLIKQQPEQRANPLSSIGTEWYLRINLEADAIRRFDPRPVLAQITMDIQGLYEHRERLFRVFEELYTNALDYGVLGLDAGMKSSPDRHADYLAEKDRRLSALSEGSIVIDIQHYPVKNGGLLNIVFEDSGQGFDYEAVKAANTTTDAVGGLGLLEDLCEEVRVHPPGNEVRVSYRWTMNSQV